MSWHSGGRATLVVDGDGERPPLARVRLPTASAPRGRVTARLASYYFVKQRNRRRGFIVVGADQTIHYATLMGTWLYFTP